MQVVIEITSPKTATRSGTSAKNGRPYTMTSQRGFLHVVDKITGEVNKVALEVPLEDGAAPYEIGTYTLNTDSVRVSQYGRLEIARLGLEPIRKPAAVATAAPRAAVA